MENISERFVNSLYDLSKSSIPEHVILKAQKCLLDYLAVTAAGSRSFLERNEIYLSRNAFNGFYHIIGMPVLTDIRNACLINAFNAHVLELDDSHRVAMTHLGAPIFSVLLSLAEANDKSVLDILKAAVVGYETAIRLANAIQPGHKKRGFHVSGTCCTIGAAMGAASLLNDSKEEYKNIFSAAATSAAGLLGVASGRSEQKPYNIAHAAVSGMDAALYGSMFTGSEDVLGDSRGFFRAMTDAIKPDQLFGSGYAIEGIYQKLYAACRHCHAPMEAALSLARNYTFSPDEIAAIHVYTYDLAIDGHSHTQIQGKSSAKQSIPYGVAAAIVYGDCGESVFSESKISNPEIEDVIKKIRVSEDPKLSELVPDMRAARVEITLENGELFSKQIDYAKGEPENPIRDEELKEKCFSLFRLAGVSKETAAEIYHYTQDEQMKVCNLLVRLNGGFNK